MEIVALIAVLAVVWLVAFLMGYWMGQRGQANSDGGYQPSRAALMPSIPPDE